MKKIIKTFAILAALAVFGTSGLFAQNVEDEVVALPEIEITEPTLEDITTIAATVKVVTKKNVTTIYLKLKDGKTYIADAFGKEGEKAVDILLKRNKKKAVVSGVLNEKTGVFKVIKMGNLKTIGNVVDEK
ncbi:MAG: hypothetical protein K5829_11040 [Treponema sp.]|nr:hypothetical protein [Treponema sp.]